MSQCIKHLPLCGGLNDRCPRQLTYLNPGSSEGALLGEVMEPLGDRGSLEEVRQ